MPNSGAIEPTKLSRELRGDLDWIVMKALEKDRNRRYETANAFAEDVKRYLNNEPVKAAAPSMFYLFRKTVRRHRAAIVTAASFLALLLVSTVVSSLLAVQANREAKNSQIAASEAEQAMKVAAAARDQEQSAREQAVQRIGTWRSPRPMPRISPGVLERSARGWKRTGSL